MLEPSAFIYPVGELMSPSFPDGDIETSLVQWIINAAARVTTLSVGVQDAAATHLVYGDAYQAIATRIAMQPNEEKSFNDVSRSIGADRVRFWEQRAQAKFDAYAVLAGSATGSENIPGHSSASAAVQAVW